MTRAIWIYFSRSLIFLYFSRLKARKILRKNLGTRKIYLILHSYPYDNYYIWVYGVYGYIGIWELWVYGNKGIWGVVQYCLLLLSPLCNRSDTLRGNQIFNKK